MTSIGSTDVKAWPDEPRTAAWRQAGTRPAEAVGPNTLTRFAFTLSVFAIPFANLSVPGTGGEVGVLRLVQLVMGCAVLSQPIVCLQWVPKALFWFGAYIVLRIVWGMWLTPEMSSVWWPTSREFIEILLWVWVMFNLLQYPRLQRMAWWAVGSGCLLCAGFHLAGIGVEAVTDDLDSRSSVFGLNANELGATYACAMIALLGLWMNRTQTWTERLLPFPMIVIIGIALAKTGSRAALLILAIGVLVLFFCGGSISPKTKRLAGLLVLFAALAGILWQIPTALTRFQEINPRNLAENNPRATMAPVLWEMFLRSPLYGSGPDGYLWELTRRAMPYRINQGDLVPAHNQILMFLVETGIIGLALFSVGLGMALAAAWRARLKSCGPLPLAILVPIVVAAATVTHPWQFLVLWVAVAASLAGSGHTNSSAPRPLAAAC